MSQRFRCLCFVLSCVLAHAASASEPGSNEASAVEKKIYKKVGPGGQIIYTDKPGQDATEIKIPKGTTYKPVTTPGYSPYKNTESEQPARAKQTPFTYQSLVITKPADQETIWSNEGKLVVGVALEPALRINHKLAVSIDGKRMHSTTNMAIPLSGVDPGEHALKVEVLDDTGASQIEQSTVFFLRHHVIKK